MSSSLSLVLVIYFAVGLLCMQLLVWFAMLIRHARTKSEACVWCGYSLAGLEDTERCPECGRTGKSPAFDVAARMDWFTKRCFRATIVLLLVGVGSFCAQMFTPQYGQAVHEGRFEPGAGRFSGSGRGWVFWDSPDRPGIRQIVFEVDTQRVRVVRDSESGPWLLASDQRVANAPDISAYLGHEIPERSIRWVLDHQWSRSTGGPVWEEIGSAGRYPHVERALIVEKRFQSWTSDALSVFIIILLISVAAGGICWVKRTEQIGADS